VCGSFADVCGSFADVCGSFADVCGSFVDVGSSFVAVGIFGIQICERTVICVDMQGLFCGYMRLFGG